MAPHRLSPHGRAATPATASRRSADAVLAELGRARTSARALAVQLGWSHGQLQRRLRLNDPTPFSVDDLDAIARVLGIPLSRLVVEPPPEDSDPAVPRARAG